MRRIKSISGILSSTLDIHFYVFNFSSNYSILKYHLEVSIPNSSSSQIVSDSPLIEVGKIIRINADSDIELLKLIKENLERYLDSVAHLNLSAKIPDIFKALKYEENSDVAITYFDHTPMLLSRPCQKIKAIDVDPTTSSQAMYLIKGLRNSWESLMPAFLWIDTDFQTIRMSSDAWLLAVANKLPSLEKIAGARELFTKAWEKIKKNIKVEGVIEYVTNLKFDAHVGLNEYENGHHEIIVAIIDVKSEDMDELVSEFPGNAWIASKRIETLNLLFKDYLTGDSLLSEYDENNSVSLDICIPSIYIPKDDILETLCHLENTCAGLSTPKDKSYLPVIIDKDYTNFESTSISLVSIGENPKSPLKLDTLRTNIND